MAENYGSLSTEVTVGKYVLILEKTHFFIHTTQGMQEREQSKCINANLLSLEENNLSVLISQ